MFGLKLSVRGHQHVFQLEIPELQAFHGKIELGPEIIIMALQYFVYGSFYEKSYRCQETRFFLKVGISDKKIH